MRLRNLFVSGLLLVSACSSHGSRGGGPHGYVRCMSVSEADEREGSIGSVRFASEDRVLSFTGLSSPLRVAAFRGPGVAVSGLEKAVLGVTEQSPSLVFVLGGLGNDAAAARASIEAFAKARVPVVVVPGGDDEAEVVGKAFEKNVPANVFDGRRYRRIETEVVDFLLLAGAPEGRYATSAEHCGNDEDDREELEARSGKRAIVVSWAAPSGGGASAVGRGFDGADAGDRAIAEFLRGLEEPGGIFGFPATRAGVPSTRTGDRVVAPNEPVEGLRISVPRIAGPADERDDLGLVQNGAVVLEISGEGTSFVGLSASATEEP